MISFEIAQLMFHKPLQGGLCQIVNPYKHHHQGKAQKSEEKVGVVHSELISGGFLGGFMQCIWAIWSKNVFLLT